MQGPTCKDCRFQEHTTMSTLYVFNQYSHIKLNRRSFDPIMRREYAAIPSSAIVEVCMVPNEEKRCPTFIDVLIPITVSDMPSKLPKLLESVSKRVIYRFNAT